MYVKNLYCQSNYLFDMVLLTAEYTQIDRLG